MSWVASAESASLSVLQSPFPNDETVLVVVAAILMGVGIWYLGTRLEGVVQRETAELIRAGLLLLVALGVTGILFSQWDSSENLLLALGVIEFG
ncbi:MAG: hypothetical protein R3324_14160, partial [Halobacteriales archaeon]|nr:hypothetical protein [Halobacteriales archaeon]